jgi:hypothetical protein
MVPIFLVLNDKGESNVSRIAAFDKAGIERASLMLQKFSTGHAELLYICSTLEDIADSLLPQPDTVRCYGVAGNLLPVLAKAYRYEEDFLFPWLAKTYGTDAGLGKSITRLYFEHLEDEAYASEVVEMLRTIGSHKRFEAETAGYMLRGFFEGMRRHIAFEQDHLYRLINQQHQA